MNRSLFAARELLRAAKAILADYSYIYDPKHMNRPYGGSWEKTEKGWSRNKSPRKNKSDRDDIHVGEIPRFEVEDRMTGGHFEMNAPDLAKAIDDAKEDATDSLGAEDGGSDDMKQ